MPSPRKNTGNSSAYSKPSSKDIFQARLFKIDGQDFKVATGADAETLKAELLETEVQRL